MGVPENPPAFPASAADCNGYEGSPGMTLRDWFAGQAIPGAMDLAVQACLATGKPTPPGTVAATAYDIADAMLAQRQGVQPAPVPPPGNSVAEIAGMRAAGIANIVNGTCTSCEKTAAECQCIPF